MAYGLSALMTLSYSNTHSGEHLHCNVTVSSLKSTHMVVLGLLTAQVATRWRPFIRHPLRVYSVVLAKQNALAEPPAPRANHPLSISTL